MKHRSLNNLDQTFSRRLEVAVVLLRTNDEEDSFNDEDGSFLIVIFYLARHLSVSAR